MADWGVVFEWDGAPCGCRCRHCCLNSGAPASVPYERAKAVAERFLEWTREAGAEHLKMEFGAGFSYECALPQLVDYVSFRREHQMAGSDYLPLNGLRVRDQNELRQMLNALREAGIQTVNLSFYGFGENHDRFARREGDFAYLLLLAEVAEKCALNRSETIFLRKGALADLPQLLDTMDVIPGLVRREVCPWDYRGRAVNLEHDRPELSDVEALPDYIREAVNLKRYRTEGYWIDAILAGVIPPHSERIYFIAVRDDNIEYLEREPWERMLREMRAKDEARRQGEPRLADLARRYGDPGNIRLYALRDLEWKWLGEWYAQRDPAAAEEVFDPARSHVVLR